MKILTEDPNHPDHGAATGHTPHTRSQPLPWRHRSGVVGFTPLQEPLQGRSVSPQGSHTIRTLPALFLALLRGTRSGSSADPHHRWGESLILGRVI